MSKLFVQPNPPRPTRRRVLTRSWENRPFQSFISNLWRMELTLCFRTRTRLGKKEAPILIATPTPSPSPSARPLSRAAKKKKARQAGRGLSYNPKVSTRIDRHSGRIKKLSPQRRRNDAAPKASQHSQPATRGARGPRCLTFPKVSANSIMPFEIEHSLFTTVQRLAEQALFFWTRKWISVVLARQNWAVPEQGELNWWIRALEPFSHDVSRALQDSNARISWLDLKVSIEALHPLRHSAVHRISRPLQAILHWVSTAVRLCSYLNDALRIPKLKAIEVALATLDLRELEAVIGKPTEEFTNTRQVAQTPESGDHRRQSLPYVRRDDQLEARKVNDTVRREPFGEATHNRQDTGAISLKTRDLAPGGVRAAGENFRGPFDAGRPDLFSSIESDPDGLGSSVDRKHDSFPTPRESHPARRVVRDYIDMTEDSEDEVSAVAATQRCMEEAFEKRETLVRGGIHLAQCVNKVIDLTESSDGESGQGLQDEEEGGDEARLYFPAPQPFLGLLN